MKKIMLVIIVALAFIVSGCTEDRSDRQLRLEKAQIAQELKETREKMQAEIDAQAQTIKELEENIASMTSTINGYNTMLMQIIPENEKLRAEIEELTKKFKQLEQSLTGEGKDPEKAQQAIEQLKQLQQQAVEQKQ